MQGKGVVCKAWSGRVSLRHQVRVAGKVRCQPEKESKTAVEPATSTGSGGNGSDTPGGGGPNGGNGDDDEDEEYLSKNEATDMASGAGATLPSDFLASAASGGIKKSAVAAYLALQGTFLAGWLARTIPWFRNRLVYDNKFLFKVGAEVSIDSTCATFAEVRKRGDEFWGEFEFYLSDLLVGLVLDVVLVGLMAPTAVLGRARPIPVSGLQKQLSKIPSAVFERSIPGVRDYTLGARFACVGVKFLEYSLAGMFCGLVGQGIANAAMMARRAHDPSADYGVEPPPLLKTALVWGLFMGASSNLRYQAVFGLERLVDMTIAKRIPAIAYGSTVVIRFVNNVIGGENFIDMARFFGVQ